MSFGESVFSAGFMQKIIKGDQNDKLNHAYMSQKLLQKVSEDTRSHATEAEGRRLTCRLPGPLGPPVMLHFDVGSSTAS